MKIAIISTILRPTLPAGLGGMATFNYNLSSGLVQAGEDITLFATSDSQTKAKLCPITERPILADDESAPSLAQKNLENAALVKIMRYIKNQDFDLIHHSHNNFIAVYLSIIFGLKSVLTFHVAKDIDFIDNLKYSLGEKFSEIKCIAISKAQEKLFQDIDFYGQVYNGTDLSQFEFNDSPQDYLCWMGRIAQYKGTKEAVEVATKTNKKLKVAGPVNNQDYWGEVKSGFNEKIEYLGIVDANKRKILLKNAKALLFPIDWEEPFGLIMIEAMACGTPVIAFRRGAVSEIVKNGVTGFVCQPKNMRSMIEAVGRIYQMKGKDYRTMRQACKEHVEKNFSMQQMVKNYRKIYQKILQEGGS